MKKLNSILCALFAFICLLFSCSCSIKEELTTLELAMVGTWELVEIRSQYKSYSMNNDGSLSVVDSYQYSYPNNEVGDGDSATDRLFEELVEKYWDRTEFLFKDNKKDGYMDGGLIIGDTEQVFSWRESSSGISVGGIHFDIIFEGKILSQSIEGYGNAFLCSKDQIIVGLRDGYYSTTYIFEKESL